MQRNISKEVVATIKKEKIKPIEKWRINFKNYLYWGVVALMILLSGAFFSLIILSIVDFGPEMFIFLKFGKFLRILIFAAPYLWIVAFSVCVVLGVLIFQKTKTGYRYNVLFIASVILLIVSVLGVAAHFSKMNARFEHDFLERDQNPRMMMMLEKDGKMFPPEEGVLIGEIVNIEQQLLRVKNSLGEEWNVEYSERTRIGRDVDLAVGEKLLIIGKKKESNNFVAFGIKSFEGKKAIKRTERLEEAVFERGHLRGEAEQPADNIE